MIVAIILTVFAYLLGSVPSAYIMGKWLHGRNITQLGNHNVGTVNAWKEFGWHTGIVVLILDMMKGAGVMALILVFGFNELTAFGMALAVTLGHNFSLFLNFRGGKGAATVLGLSLVIVPFLTLMAILVIPIIYHYSRSVIWSFFAALVALNILTIATGQPASQVGLCIVLSFVVIGTHVWRERKEVIAALQKFDIMKLGQIE